MDNGNGQNEPIDAYYLFLLLAFILSFSFFHIKICLIFYSRRVFNTFSFIMLCSPEPPSLTLEVVLNDPSSDLFKEFANYLRQSYCIENLDFWIAVQEYKECTNDKSLALRCEDMINEYIRPNSPQEINIPCDMREAILDFYQQGNYHPKLFGAAAEAVLELMRVNSFIPWLMLNANSEHWERSTGGIKHSASSTSLSDKLGVKLKQISRKSWSSFDYPSGDSRFLFSVTSYSNNSVCRSMLKKLKRSFSGHQRQ